MDKYKDEDYTVWIKKSDAVGDGDVTAVVQAALDSDKDTIEFDSGTYVITSTLYLSREKMICCKKNTAISFRPKDGVSKSIIKNANHHSRISRFYSDLRVYISGGKWINESVEDIGDADDVTVPGFFDISGVRAFSLHADYIASGSLPAVRIDHATHFSITIERLEINKSPHFRGVVVNGCCHEGHVLVDLAKSNPNRMHPEAKIVELTADVPNKEADISGPITNTEIRLWGNEAQKKTTCAIAFNSVKSTISSCRVLGKSIDIKPSFNGKDYINGAIYDIKMKGLKGKTLAEREPRGEIISEPMVFKSKAPLCITSPFGERIHPITGEKRFHAGVDCAVWNGKGLIEDFITIPQRGRVIEISENDEAGINISVDHYNGFVTRYFHLEPNSIPHYFRVGTKLKKRDVIGFMGTTGRSTGEHLHFQVEKDGVPVDPIEFLKTPEKSSGQIAK